MVTKLHVAVAAALMLTGCGPSRSVEPDQDRLEPNDAAEQIANEQHAEAAIEQAIRDNQAAIAAEEAEKVSAEDNAFLANLDAERSQAVAAALAEVRDEGAAQRKRAQFDQTMQQVLAPTSNQPATPATPKPRTPD